MDDTLNRPPPTRLTRVRDGLLLAMLVAAPIAVGGIYKWAWPILVWLALASGALTLIDQVFIRHNVPKIDGFAGLVYAFVGVVGLQLVPFPPALMSWLSPKRLEHQAIIDHLATGNGTVAAIWLPLSAALGPTRDDFWVVAACAVVLMVGRQIGRYNKDVRWWYGAIGIIGCVVAAGSIVLWLFQGGQLHASLGHPNRAAVFFALSLPLLVALHRTASPCLDRSAHWRLGLIVVGALLTQIALLLTLSRWGIISALVSATVTGFLFAGYRRFRSAATGTVILALFGLIMLFLLAQPIWARFGLLFGADSLTNNRARCWGYALGIVRDFPWFGSGAGSFRYVFPAYQMPDLNGWWKFAHNDYLNLLCDTGVCGALLVGTLLVAAIRRALRVRHSSDPQRRWLAGSALAAIGALLVHSLGDFNLQIPAIALEFSLILGLLVGVAESEDGAPPVSLQPERDLVATKAPGYGTRFAAGALAACMLACAWPLGRLAWSGGILFAAGEHRRWTPTSRPSRKQVRSADEWLKRATRLDRAFQLDPWDVETAYECSLAFLAAGEAHVESTRGEQLESRAREVLARNRQACALDGRAYYLEAYFSLKEGDLDRADAALWAAGRVWRGYWQFTFRIARRLVDHHRRSRQPMDRSLLIRLLTPVAAYGPWRLREALILLVEAGASPDELERMALVRRDGLWVLGNFYVERRQWEHAVSAFLTAIEQRQSGRTAAGRRNHVRALLYTGRFGAAREEAIRYIMEEARPGAHGRAAAEMLSEFRRIRLHAMGDEVIQRARAALPDEVELLSVQARAAEQMGDRERAIELRSRYASVQPGFRAFMELGRLYRSVRQPRVALAHFDRALQFAPDSYAANWQRAKVLLELHHDTEAAESLAQLSANHPRQPDPYLTLARLYEKNRKFDKARKILLLGLRNVDPRHAGLRRALERIK